MPLKKGKKHMDANFHELRHGKQFKKTAKKHGKKTAHKQMIAIALKEAGLSRKAQKKRVRKGRGK
jgi:hypothetical protein